MPEPLSSKPHGNESLLRVEALQKVYSVPVLSGIDLEIKKGEVLALVGANGAGKSTLAKILTGLVQKDEGNLTFEGRAYNPANKQQAESAGVHIVQQELNLLGTLTVAENLFLNHLPRNAFGWIDRTQLHQQAKAALQKVGLGDLDPGMITEQLGVGQQQLVEIAAALANDCRLLVLDEPTAALTDPQIDLLFQQIDKLTSVGVGVLYISHRMQELQRIAHRMVVLRDGNVVLEGKTADLELASILQAMAGRPLQQQSYFEERPKGKTLLKVESLSCEPVVQNVSFEVKQGEVFGIAGLVGSGRTELLRTLFGADQASSGSLSLQGHEEKEIFSGTFNSPRQATRAGMAMIPEDRKQQGLLLPQSISLNIMLNNLQEVANRIGWVSAGQEQSTALRSVEELQLKMDGLAQPIEQLSGGNQQKAIIGRWLLQDSDVYLFDEPTRGVDMSAKESIYRILNNLAQAQKAIVIVSSELEELMSVCDRIGVMSAGEMVSIFERDHWSQEAITQAAFQGYLS